MRHLGFALAVLGTLPGCTQLFGLEETSLEDGHATFTLTRIGVGGTVQQAPMDLSIAQASYLVADAGDVNGFLRVTPELEPPNLWRADIPQEVASEMLYTIDEGDDRTRHYAVPSRSIAAPFMYLGHLANEPVPTGAAMEFNVKLAQPYAAGQTLSWLSLGTWSSQNFGAAAVPAVGGNTLNPPPVVFPRTSTRHVSSDVLTVLQHSGRQLVGQLVVPSFAQPAAVQPILGAMTAVATDQSLSMTVDSTAIATRLGYVQPALGAPTVTWAISAAPGADAGFVAGPVLNAGTIASGAGVVPVVAAFGNPFVDQAWPSALAVAATATRSYSAPAIPAVTLSGRMLVVMPPPNDNRPVAFEVCMPTSIAVQGATLISDGLTVTIDRSKPLSISFVADNQDADVYTLDVFELVVRPGNPATSSLVNRFHSFSSKPVWSLPGETLQANKVYVVRAGCSNGGYPNLDAGDLLTRKLPLSTAFLDSGVFTVAGS